jgi:hypothetical protein
MTYFKGAALSFILFSLYLYFSLLNRSEGDNGIWYGVFVTGFFIVYAVCFATEMIIKIAETYSYEKKFDWLIIPAALIVSFPFWSFTSLFVSIFVGAFGFYTGRRLPNHRFILGLTPLPVVFVFIAYLLSR